MRGLCQDQLSQVKAQSSQAELVSCLIPILLLFFLNILPPPSFSQSAILCLSFFNRQRMAGIKMTGKMTDSIMNTDCMTNILYKTCPGLHDLTLHAIIYFNSDWCYPAKRQTVKGQPQKVLDSMQYLKAAMTFRQWYSGKSAVMMWG